MRSHEELIEEAIAETGLTDFGGDSFREGLEILVTSLRDEADLNGVGEHVLHSMVLNFLVQRLRIEDWYSRHPEIDDEPLMAPLIGLGLPRTGSTALSHLLALDDATRSPLVWQVSNPCPPPSTVEPPDPRIERTRQAMEMQQQVAPRIGLLVPQDPVGPAECMDLMALDFKAHMFQAYAKVPTYSEWLHHRADLTSTYAYERRALKLLQWGYPPMPWRLKTPSHLPFISTLGAAFPEARFVMTHRDPVEVMVSSADLYLEVAKMFTDRPDPVYIGELNVECWSLAMARTIEYRDGGEEHRFHDIDFRDMQRDPIGSVEALYAWMGEPVSPEFEARMREWWSTRAEDRATTEKPSASYFGIDPDAVRPLFAEYVDRWVR